MTFSSLPMQMYWEWYHKFTMISNESPQISHASSVVSSLLHNTYFLNICTVIAGNHKRQGSCFWLVQIFLSGKKYSLFGTQAHCLYTDYIKIKIRTIFHISLFKLYLVFYITSNPNSFIREKKSFPVSGSGRYKHIKFAFEMSSPCRCLRTPLQEHGRTYRPLPGLLLPGSVLPVALPPAILL